ncbi:MAG: hypothetical protein ACR2PR_09210 [Pseudohongiellaceae bacterium]
MKIALAIVFFIIATVAIIRVGITENQKAVDTYPPGSGGCECDSQGNILPYGMEWGDAAHREFEKRGAIKIGGIFFGYVAAMILLAVV